VLRVVLRIALVLAALRAIGAVVARRGNVGDDESNEFSIAAIFGGASRASRATALQSGEVLAVCGGVELDLREAILDPAGADLVVRACMGGVEIAVPATWRVTVEGTPRAGGIEVAVTPDSDLPADAPLLRISATAVLGGIEVTTGLEDDVTGRADVADG
jgi:predicted membrane protein